MADEVAIPTGGTASWVQRKSPNYEKYAAAESVQRASYIATRAALAPYLVPHRFEGRESMEPTELRRAQLGYGIGLNRSYLHEIMGHIRGAPARYFWGPMSPKDENAITEAPQDASALMMWQDATRDGTNWRNLYLRRTLEWMLSSPGGVVVVDTPKSQGKRLTATQAKAAGVRPFQRFIPWSEVWDFSWGATGFEWIKILARKDRRTPKEAGNPKEQEFTLFELVNQTTVVSTWKANGERSGADVQVGKLVDRQGQPAIPVFRATHGDHASIDTVGAGLIADLTDVVVDTFNVVSEMREAYRDAAFALFGYRGSNWKQVQERMEEGTRLVHVGDSSDDDLFRIGVDAAEVSSGLDLVKFNLSAWAWAARRNAADAVNRSSQGPRSGVSVQAEFNLDLVPLLIECASSLDEVESSVMHMTGQLMGKAASELKDVGVERDQSYQVEEESARISRIVADYATTGIPLPPELAGPIAASWSESLDFVDLEQMVETEDEDGNTTEVRLGDVVADRTIEMMESDAEAARNLSAFGNPGQLPPFPEV